MIFFITKASKTYTLLSFLNTWGGSIRKMVAFLPYEKLVRAKRFYSGTYILTDYDLLSEKQLLNMNRIYEEFKKYPFELRLLNDPTVSLSRLQQLKILFDSGINPFRCFPLSKKPNDIHYPVFVRKGADHDGKISDIIKQPEELELTVQNILNEGFGEDEILITEFTDTSDKNKIFRKYAAFILGDEIVPRHIFFSKKWMIKGADLTENYMISEEIEFLKTNPHRNQLHKIFQLVGINYGRIDYSLLYGKIVVWEINPNPMIASSSSLKKSKRKTAHDLFAENFIRAFNKINHPGEGVAIKNPLYISEKLPKEVKQIFSFSQIKYLNSNLYQNIKSILLFYFYIFRNALKN
ncbi:MAG TPA: hypothetical protein VKA38_02170 [Draconibacterium sp.]|nr:hypothetical protein [Draconibacterium sp.]